MASAFGHMAVAYAMGKTINPKWASMRFWVLTGCCCLLPDADVLGLVFGVPYEHMWGHRGLTHSITFAVVIGLMMPKLAVPSISGWSCRYGLFAIYFGLVTLSHGLLDACTDGGLGIAFFAPFDEARYFFFWRPIAVSPIGLSPFFSSWGLAVLANEFFWIGIPVIFWLLGERIVRR